MEEDNIISIADPGETGADAAETGVRCIPVMELGGAADGDVRRFVLCRTVREDAPGTYVILTVREDAEGGAAVTGIRETGVECARPPIPGGWYAPGSVEIGEEQRACFEKALRDLPEHFVPAALLGSQVVAGMNYRVLCRADPASPDGDPAFALVRIFRDLRGNVSVLEFTRLEPEEIQAPPVLE